MKKTYLFIALFCFIFSFTQEKKIDSLLIVLDNTKNTKQQAVILNTISDAYKTIDANQMQKFGNNALKIARQTHHKIEEARALQNIGTSHIILGEYDLALKNFDTAENMMLKLGQNTKPHEEILAKIFGSKGVVFSEQNKYAKALQYDFKALNLYQKLENKTQTSKVLNNIGVIYRSINDEENALRYFLQSYQIQKETKDAALAISCSNIGLIYLHENQLSKAKFFFDESEKELAKNENPRALGELYNNFSKYHQLKNQPEISKEYLLKAEETFLSIDDKFGLSDTYLFLAKFYFSHHKMNKALFYANKSLTLAKELELPETRMSNEKLLSEIYEEQGNETLAFLHLKNYEKENTILEKEANAKERIKTELNFQYEKEKLQEKEENNRKKLKWIFGAAILGILSISLFFYYRNRASKKNIILQKQLLEFEHKALHLQMNPHFVFNCLAAISAFMMQNDKEEAVKYLAKFSKLMRLTLEYSKESLIPIDKEIESLKNYLELEQLRFKNKFDFTIDKSAEIEDDTAIPSLLLQPYIENAIIHGVVPKEEKGNISIKFTQTAEHLICEIKDTGIGIENSKKIKEKSVNIHKSLALEISRKRLETLQKIDKKEVSLDIKQINENGGTKILLKIPLQFLKK